MTEQPDTTTVPGGDPDEETPLEQADPPSEATQPLDQAVEPSSDAEDAVIEQGAHA